MQLLIDFFLVSSPVFCSVLIKFSSFTHFLCFKKRCPLMKKIFILKMANQFLSKNSAPKLTIQAFQMIPSTQTSVNKCPFRRAYFYSVLFPLSEKLVLLQVLFQRNLSECLVVFQLAVVQAQLSTLYRVN